MSESSKAFSNLVKNSSMMFLLNLAGVGVSVLTIPVTLRIIGVESYGHLVLVQSIALTIFTICSFQYWQGMLVAMPGHGIGPAQLRATVLKSFGYEAAGISCALVGALVLYLLHLTQTAEFSFGNILLLSMAAVLPVIGTHTAYFRLVNRYQVLLVAGLLSSLIKLFFLHLVARYQPTISNLVLIYALPEFIRCALLFAYIYKTDIGIEGGLSPSQISGGRIREIGRWSTLQAICDLPVAQVDRVIIGFSLPGDKLGVFSILKRIFAMVNLATAPFYSTSIPEFSARVNSGDVRGAFELWIKTMKMLFSVTAAAALGCYLLKGFWMPLIFPGLRDYLAEFGVVLVTAVVAGTFVTTHSLFWSLGKLRQSTLIAVGSNVLYLLVLLLLTLQAGLFGAVAAFLVHVMVVASVKIFLLQRIKTDNK